MRQCNASRTSSHGRSARARTAAALIAVVGALGCSSTIGEAPVANVIEVAPFSASIDVGKTLVLYASVLDVGGRVITSGQSLTWSSSTPAVATIDASGKVTGVAPGDARITVRLGRVSGSAAITVVIPAPSRVDIPAVTTPLSRGDTLRVSALAISEAGPAFAGRGFSWRSDNVSVATVTPSADSTTAIVRAIAPGIASISATNLGVTGRVTVQVAADPVINFGVGTVALAGTAGGSDPAPQLVSITNSGGGSLRGLAVSSIAYGGGATGWLQASIVTPSEGARLRLAAVTAGIPTGSYSATVTVTSTAPAVAPRTINVSLAVAPPPVLTLSTTTVAFGAAIGGSAPAAQGVNITNTGGGTLSGLTVSSPVTPGGQAVTWLSATLSATTAPATLTLQANPTGLAIGSYQARVTVSAAGADGSPRTIDVSLVVSQNATIILTPTALTLSAVAGSTPPATTIAVSNGGGGTLSGLSLGPVQYGSGASGWLVVTLGATQAPAQVTVAAASASLAAGTYSATVQVRSSLAGVAPATLTVTLSVRNAAMIVASTASVPLTATGSQPNPSRIVGVTNGGSGPLGGLSAVTTYAPSQSTGWLSTAFAGGQTTAPTSFTLQAVTSSLAAGSYAATVRLSSPDAPATTDVNVTLDVVGQLEPVVASLTLFGVLGSGASAPDTMRLVNVGAGFIAGLTSSVSYTGATGWLTRFFTSTTTPSGLVAQAIADAAAPRGTSVATVTIGGNSVAPISVQVRRTIGYVYNTHVVSGAFNVFDASKLGCTNCHGPASSRPIPFTTYASMVSGGYVRSPVTTLADTATTRVYYYVTDPSYGHGGGTYAKSNQWILRLREWIIDGSRP